MPRRVLATLALGTALAVSASARADSLTSDEIARLARAETVARAVTLDDDSRRLIGGVAYTLVDASGAEMQALLEDVDAYRTVLPRTKSAKLVDENGQDRFIELHQGNSIFETTYTIRVHAEPMARDGTRTVRFWMDPSRPHGIDDAWGFFRWTPTRDGKVLLTFAALVDTGPGIVRAFFEEKLRAAMLSVPERVRGWVAHHHLLARR